MITSVNNPLQPRPKQDGRHTPNLWPVWLVAPGALLLVGAAALGLYHGAELLLSSEATGKKPVGVQDVIKTTVTVLTLIGAVLAALYAYRKQLLDEGTSHRADATQLTERYTKAAEQLGHEQPAVRLAGVYAMARLADDWPEQRQVCVDVLCAYLRMPYETDTTAPAFRHGEREVRLTIIPTIRNHLQDPTADTTWCGFNLDFTGATFDGGDFTGSFFSGGEVDFGGSTFSGGDTYFRHAIFSGGQIYFNGTTFSGGRIYFNGATFSGSQIYFNDATFSGGRVYFFRSTFSGGQVNFGESIFSDGEVDFGRVKFAGGQVYFNRSKFSGGKVFFTSSEYDSGVVSFVRSTFSGGEVLFSGSTFSGAKIDFSPENADPVKNTSLPTYFEPVKSQPSRLASAMRSMRLSRISTSRGRSAGSGRSMGHLKQACS
ncbi:pentapeptide repeat-containing protein [Streptomyces microflavus]|uniref:pentapeptide repeat-containing protein n=1 Tax=Streptomyces microflavus TaxID=1919 RepID=UPI002E1430F1|nr:pentapeptide repeat-containing protein [Streptomyces microflavus]